MMKSSDTEPWRGLPPEIADLIEPELASISGEILDTIAAEVPEYARPLEGSFGRGIRTGVAEALRQFAALIRDPDAGRERGRDVYVGLGRGELRQGRTLDSLQSAYRVGARVAWRRLAAAGRQAGVDPEVLILLAESIFAYIDELAADSVDGYADAQAEVEDVRRRRRRALATLMLSEPAAEQADLEAASRAAGWPLPRRVAAIACPQDVLASIAHRLPADVLAAAIDERGCVVVPDPDGPGRREALTHACAAGRAAIGPAGGLRDLPGSWALACTALSAAEAAAIPSAGLIRAEDHLGELMLFGSRPLLGRIRATRLASLADLRLGARARMEETALAFVRCQGNAAAVARTLHIHPQTARYRIAKLRDLLGGQLDDPDARFEIEASLRGLARPLARQRPEDHVP